MVLRHYQHILFLTCCSPPSWPSPLGWPTRRYISRPTKTPRNFSHCWALGGIWQRRRWRLSSRPLLFLYSELPWAGWWLYPWLLWRPPLVASPRLSWAVRWVSSAVRSIPAVLWAVFFVILVGPGPAAGALALALYTSTYLVKLFYEALEAVERELYDSLRAIGLRGLPLAALFTHVKRQVVSHVLFMLEYNVRTATILGFVGAGGVGSTYSSTSRYWTTPQSPHTSPPP